MAVYMVPGVFGVGGQVLDSNGKVASGALVNVYAAGTVSVVNTFKDSLGAVTASNPIVTNSDGRLPNEMWQTAGTAIKIVLTDALANTLGTYDNLTGINDPTTILTTTNNWTVQQNFNSIQVTTLNVSVLSVSTLTISNVVSTLNVSLLRVTQINVTNLNVSTLSVASVTAGVVPFARMQRAYQEAYLASGNGLISVTVNVSTGDLIYLNASGQMRISPANAGALNVQIGKTSGTAVLAIHGQAFPGFQQDLITIPTLTAAGTSYAFCGTWQMRVSSSGFATIGIISIGNGFMTNADAGISVVVINHDG